MHCTKSLSLSSINTQKYFNPFKICFATMSISVHFLQERKCKISMPIFYCLENHKNNHWKKICIRGVYSQMQKTSNVFIYGYFICITSTWFWNTSIWLIFFTSLVWLMGYSIIRNLCLSGIFYNIFFTREHPIYN